MALHLLLVQRRAKHQWVTPNVRNYCVDAGNPRAQKEQRVMNTIRNHRDLEAWQVAMELTTETYRLTGDLSVERNVRFAVADAACRALEYRGRAGAASGCRCQPPVIAGGSLAELDTQLEVAIRLKYLVEDAVLEFRRLHESSRRLVFGLRRSKRAQLVGAAAKSASVFLFVFYTFSQILS